jgi:hypothetical protein
MSRAVKESVAVLVPSATTEPGFADSEDWAAVGSPGVKMTEVVSVACNKTCERKYALNIEVVLF